MARIFEPAKQKRADDRLALKFLNAHKANDYYKKNKIGFEVNDGKYLTYVDDREVANE